MAAKDVSFCQVSLHTPLQRFTMAATLAPSCGLGKGERYQVSLVPEGPTYPPTQAPVLLWTLRIVHAIKRKTGNNTGAQLMENRLEKKKVLLRGGCKSLNTRETSQSLFIPPQPSTGRRMGQVR